MADDQGRKAHLRISFVAVRPASSFRMSSSFCAFSAPAGITIRPRGLSCSIEHRRYPLRRRSHHDLVVRCVLWPPVVTVAQPDFDVVVFEISQSPAGFMRKLLDYLNRIYALRELGEDRRLISKPGANFEDLVCRSISSRSVISATMNGWEIVFVYPIGNGKFRYANCLSAVGTNSWRGTLAITLMTRSSSWFLPIREAVRRAHSAITSTISMRSARKSISSLAAICRPVRLTTEPVT